jgi:hypothetical protein
MGETCSTHDAGTEYVQFYSKKKAVRKIFEIPKSA